MLVTYKLLLSTHFKKKQFHTIIKRLMKNSTFRCKKSELDKPRGKITVIKRRLQGDKENSILEWKSAESVIKRLNWENKCLFGPIQHTKTNTYAMGKALESDDVQHKIPIPIIEPHFDHGKSTPISNNSQKYDLSSILTFPFVNNLVHPTSKIKEVNYLRKHLEALSEHSIPSVSLILKETMPKERAEILDQWKQNMIKQLGEKGFERYHTELLANGSSLHNSISFFLTSTPERELEIKEENIGHWKSLKHVFPNIKDVKLLEEFVTHPFLCYRGIVDCFAKYKDHLVVIDWKTSKKPKTNIKNTYDDPLQVAAYVGALNFDPKFQYLASKGLIVVAYESGIPATVHFMDEPTMKHYWNEWLMRLKQFWEMKHS